MAKNRSGPVFGRHEGLHVKHSCISSQSWNEIVKCNMNSFTQHSLKTSATYFSKLINNRTKFTNSYRENVQEVFRVRRNLTSEENLSACVAFVPAHQVHSQLSLASHLPCRINKHSNIKNHKSQKTSAT